MFTPLRRVCYYVFMIKLLIFITLFIAQTGALLIAPLLFIDQPQFLMELEKRGLSFSKIVTGTNQQASSNKTLYLNSFYKSIADSISTDLDDLKSKDRLLSVTMARSHRLFNKKWLTSKAARFELVGIVNRVDRMPFAKGTCGEVRLIYRLSYRIKTKQGWVHSRLPFTTNAVYWLKKQSTSCSEIAKKWNNIKAKNRTQLLAELFASDGILSPSVINVKNQKSIEVNMQSVRWPSTIRPDMGGYAEYLQRVFKRNTSRKIYQLSPLENTPDVEKLASSAALKSELKRWLKDPTNLKKIDAGTVVIPERFLSRKVTSFALHGMARLANRPFDQLFKENDFKEINYSDLQHVKSPKSLLRRLNDMSCVGCHQGRTIAGFHFLGKDRKETHSVNAIFTAGSPHFVKDMPRRKQFLASLAKGQYPSLPRPFSERADSGEGGYGSHCGLSGKAGEDYRSWTCQAGYSCMSFDNNPASGIGRCIPTKRGRAGDPCQVGSMQQISNPHRDKIVAAKDIGCAEGYHCEVTQVGFPSGMCSNGCRGLRTGEACGSIAILYGFNQCLVKGRKPFFQCLADNVRPGSLRACDDKNPCRDDYICARIEEQKGACIPPYFLFQLRVDGHPRPT